MLDRGGSVDNPIAIVVETILSGKLRTSARYVVDQTPKYTPLEGPAILEAVDEEPIDAAWVFRQCALPSPEELGEKFSKPAGTRCADLVNQKPAKFPFEKPNTLEQVIG